LFVGTIQSNARKVIVKDTEPHCEEQRSRCILGQEEEKIKNGIGVTPQIVVLVVEAGMRECALPAAVFRHTDTL
jgi:hypothetical protein